VALMVGRKGVTKLPAWLMVLYILSLFFSGCGGGGGGGGDNSSANTSAGTGSIQFNIAWENAPVSTSTSTDHPSAELDCAASGIFKVKARVYDGSNLLADPNEWECSAHSGTIPNIQAGANRTLVIFGKDSQGNNTFIGGPLGGITILPNQTYNAGTITAIPYSITLVSPANNSSVVTCNFGFQWSGTSAAKYEIQIDDSTDFSSPTITQILNQKSYTPANLDPGKYYWRVRADDGLGNLSKWSETWSLTVVTGIGQPPPVPSGVNANPGDGQISLSWNIVAGATSYNLYWSTSPGVTKTTGTKISNVANPYTHTGRTNGTTYYYVVTGVNSCGESSESSEVSATPEPAPPAPTGVTAIAGDGQISIGLNSVPGATGYNLYWSTSHGVTKTTGTKISIVTSPYTHTGRTNGTTYYYVVTAVNRYGESSESSEVSATPGRPPSPPAGVTATAGDGQISISWTLVPGTASYNLYWSTSPGVTKTTGTKISNVTSPFTHTGITNGTTYYYVVTAVNSYGESSESTEVWAIPGRPPSSPEGVTARAGDGQIVISWKIVHEATSYNLYWSTNPGVTKTTGTKISNVTRPYTHTGITNGTTYYYVVTAVNSYGESGESNEASATPTQ
jgi:fibronectin type 3 domain-containing protein